MYSVTKVFRIPIGHRLSKHQGLCKNIHGHNFKIEVKISRKELNENDMVIDFSDLKKIVNGILDNFDHALMLNSGDNVCVSSKTIYLKKDGVDPTAERLAEYLYNEIKQKFFFDELRVNSVRVWENDDSYAEYVEDQ